MVTISFKTIFIESYICRMGTNRGITNKKTIIQSPSFIIRFQSTRTRPFLTQNGQKVDIKNSRVEFDEALQTALNSFDSIALSHSSLLAWMPVGTEPHSLRAEVIAAIESLHPPGLNKPNHPTQRQAEILRLRYIEDLPLKEVATSLGLGERQVRRETEKAVEALAEVLIKRWGLKIPSHAVPASYQPNIKRHR